MRDHSPITIDDFNGLWARGDDDTTPLDHFSTAENIQYFDGGFQTRDGVSAYQSGSTILGDILRIQPYRMVSGETLLVLDTSGNIHHVVSSTVTHTNILSKALMTDFNVVSIDGRAYITPFFTDSDSIEKGLQNEFLYVYKGDGTVARKAAGNAPTGTPLVATFGSAGFSDLGFHIFAVVYETDTGYLTALGPAVFGTATATDTVHGYAITNVPVSPDTFVTKRHIVATKFIQNYNGNQDQYDFFFIPNGTINDNVTTSINVSFFDVDLTDDASHLIDNFSQIPAGVGLCTYHGRLVLTTTFTDISIAYASEAGEPEAINQVDGLMIVPLDGNPLTNCQAYRDVLYLFKPTRTVGYNDNQDIPATWLSFVVDESNGTSVHGVATVLDSGGVNVDFLIIANYNGIRLFTGSYEVPELSYKINNFWLALDRTKFRAIEIVNNTITKRIYTVLPDGTILYCDYEMGLTASLVKWAHWTYGIIFITTIEITQIDQVILGAKKV